MPWTIDDHRASAEEAIDWGLMSGNVPDLARVPEPQQSSEHQARVTALTVFHNIRLGNDLDGELERWAPGKWPVPSAPPVDPPDTGWGDGRAFGNRPDAGGQVRLVGESNVVIEDLFFEEGDYIWQPGRPHNAHVAILLIDCENITVRNVDFRNVSEPVAVIGGSDITVEYTRTDGIVGPGSRVNEQTGNFLQTVNEPSFVQVMDNKIRATTTLDPWNGEQETMTEDAISLYSASDCFVAWNRIDATGYKRDYGTGIIAGDALGNRHHVEHNWLLNPGQVGLATAGGFDHYFGHNMIWRDADQRPGSGNTAAYYWPYRGNPIGGGVYEGNRAKWHGGGGFWNPGDATEIGNNWDDDTLTRDMFDFAL